MKLVITNQKGKIIASKTTIEYAIGLAKTALKRRTIEPIKITLKP